MNTKHTPGPWLMAGDDFVYALNERGTNSFTVLIQTAGEWRISNEERAANARLIAAAPDLLVALNLVRMSAGWQYLSEESRRVIANAIAAAAED
jgi:hypothetical protein